MAQTAANLVDHVVRHVPVRQWVLSLSIPLRLLLAAQPMSAERAEVRNVVRRYLRAFAQAVL
jgi:hypothetical protein